MRSEARKAYEKQWRLENKEKCNGYTRAYYSRNQEVMSQRTRKYNLKSQYGIDEQRYQKMLSEQKGLCAICGTDKPTGKWKVFAVDHCHVTGTVRGLLCNECNRGMGLLRDNAELLRKAANYLERTND